jgi:hypothetical protein
VRVRTYEKRVTGMQPLTVYSQFNATTWKRDVKQDIYSVPQRPSPSLYLCVKFIRDQRFVIVRHAMTWIFLYFGQPQAKQLSITEP